MRRQDTSQKDWLLKLLSLAFAITLWFFVVGEEKAEISLSIPLEIVNLPAGLTIANDIPPSIDVRVYGPRSMIKAVASQGLSRVIDLRGASAGHLTVQITPESLPFPSGLRVMRIQPSHLDIILEALTKKNVPVKAVLEGRPDRDFVIRNVVLDPGIVTLEGPKSEVSKLKDIRTLPINLNGASKNFTKSVGLDLQGLHVTVEGKSMVDVTVNLTHALTTKKITHIPVQVETTRPGISWWPQVVSMELRGWTRILRNIQPEDIKVIVPTRDLSPGLHRVTPKYQVPKGLTPIRTIPRRIRVKIPR